LLTAIRDRPSGETILQAFGRFVLQPRGILAAPDEASAQKLLEISRMIAQSPALLGREQQIFAGYTVWLTQVIADETRAGPDDPRPAVAASALIGVHRVLIDHVRRHILSGDDDLARLARSTRASTRKALALLEHGLGDYGGKRG
jgi:hypothetical protein